MDDLRHSRQKVQRFPQTNFTCLGWYHFNVSYFFLSCILHKIWFCFQWRKWLFPKFLILFFTIVGLFGFGTTSWSGQKFIGKLPLDKIWEYKSPTFDEICQFVSIFYHSINNWWYVKNRKIVKFLIFKNVFLDEERQISALVCKAISIMDLDLVGQYDRQLKLYTECRVNFKKMETVLYKLVHMSLKLSVSVKNSAKSLIAAKAFLQVTLLGNQIANFFRVIWVKRSKKGPFFKFLFPLKTFFFSWFTGYLGHSLKVFLVECW